MNTREEIIKKAQELLACGALSKEACDAIKNDLPELAESEDERMRKDIIRFLEVEKEDRDSPFFDMAIAYLEKQKKSDIPCSIYVEEAVDAFEAEYEKQKEPHIPWYDYQKSKEAGYTIVPNEEYEQLIKQKEQKELPLMDGNADLYFDEWNQQKQNPTKRQCFEEGMRYAERLQKEQQPAEWSEEDKEMLLSIINAFRNGTVSTIGQEQWLKSLPERFNLQPKAEWSEEDGKIIQRLIKDLENAETDDEDVQKELNEDVAWLKFLRPQLSDEDIKKIRSEEYTKGFNDAAFGGKAWKPSEEQMRSLEYFIRLWGDSDGQLKYVKIFNDVELLYEQLKKL